jgi:hypothetical protein
MVFFDISSNNKSNLFLAGHSGDFANCITFGGVVEVKKKKETAV